MSREGSHTITKMGPGDTATSSPEITMMIIELKSIDVGNSHGGCACTPARRDSLQRRSYSKVKFDQEWISVGTEDDASDPLKGRE